MLFKFNRGLSALKELLLNADLCYDLSVFFFLFLIGVMISQLK